MEDQVDVAEQVLHIALQDGFEGEPVAVFVNGEEVYRGANVQTDYRISLADSFDVAVPEGQLALEVRLPERGAAKSIDVDPGATPYVGVSYLDGGLQFRFSEHPFGYL